MNNIIPITILDYITDYKKYVIDAQTQLLLMQEYYRTGDIDIRDKIILANIGLIGMAVNRVKRNDYVDMLSIDDMFDDALVALIRAVDRFNPYNGTMFSTYAGVCINNAIRMHIRACNKSVNPILYLDDQIQISDDFDVMDHIEKECDIKAVLESLQILDEKESKVIRLRYLNGGPNVVPQRELEKELNITQAQISRIEKRALNKMKKYLAKRGI